MFNDPKVRKITLLEKFEDYVLDNRAS